MRKTSRTWLDCALWYIHVTMHPGESKGTFRFSIDRGGTFTDVYAECPGGKVRVMKLLSEDPLNYRDAPTEAIRRILEEVLSVENCTCIDCHLR